MKQILKNILKILTPKEKRDLGIFIILNIVVSILDIVFLTILLFLVGFYTGTHSSKAFSTITKFFVPHSLLPISAFLILFSLKNLVGFLIFKAQYAFVYAVASRISRENLLNYLEGSYYDYVNTDTSVNIRKISYQPLEFTQYMLTGIQQIVTQVALIFFTIVAIMLFNVMLFFLLLIILLPSVFIIAYITKRQLEAVRMYIRTTNQKVLQHLREALSGFVESNLYDKNDFFTNRYYNSQEKLNGYLSDQQIIQGIPSRFIEIFAVFGLFILILISNWSQGSSSIPVITIGAFIMAAYKIIPGIVKISTNVSQIKTYKFVINELLFSNAPIRKADTTGIKKIDSIEFEHVSFNYSHSILTDFNLKLNSGDFIGIHGHSGRGKTTIINLLLGFLTAEKGTIVFNDKAIESSVRQSYWSNIAYVKQQPFLINDSVLKNIVLDNNYDEHRLVDAVKSSGLDKFINTFPEGLGKIITENGKNISGGQQQRIIISRAFYKDADLIILDEPFNELDHESEISILQRLQKLAESGKIIILITHNKESLAFCTKTVSLNGK